MKDFFKNFFSAMNNRFVGHSLKKWLAVGTFWLVVVLSILYTNSSNIEGILIILTALILSLMGLNVTDKKINKEHKSECPREDPNNPVI